LPISAAVLDDGRALNIKKREPLFHMLVVARDIEKTIE
jgi:hypothetical protein